MSFPAYAHAGTRFAHDRWGTARLTLPEAERRSRTENNLMQLTLLGLMGSGFRVPERWKGKK